jgi:hypothetical protein
MEKITFKDLAIAFATDQKVNYYDDERKSNQTCRIFSLTEETVSIVSEEYQYDDLSFDKIINIIPRTTQQIINEDYVGGLEMGQILEKDEPKQETLEEAAANYLHRVADGKRTTGYSDEDFIEGAKWQQEQDKKKFSEEEVDLLHKSITMHLDDSEAERMINQIFKQFKKLDCQHQFARTGDSFDLTIYCKKCGINYKNK